MTASKTKTAPVESVTSTEPTPPTPPKKSEQLFVAYWSANGPVEDVVVFVVFGRKVDALEYAMGQSPKWDVVAVAKGQSVKAAIAG